LFSDGQTLPAIAVGNSGELDWPSGNARIQTPADCVNALSVGGCDRMGAGWKRAAYSSIGPGRSPGIMKPDGLAFGGSSREPYWVLNAQSPGAAMPITGTSFAAPTALRTGIGLKAHFGKLLTPLAIKALLLHRADDGGHDKAEVGWGRIPEDLDEIVLTDQHAAHIVYQGELRAASWVRMQIPIPSDPMTGMVEITATFWFATATDLQDPLNYTRSGLEAMLLALAALSSAQTAEPTGTLTLACKRTETDRGGAGTSSDEINIGVIVDFQKKTVLGLSGDSESVPITSISETTISFAAKETGWVMTGTLDRVTGALVASSIKSDPSTRKTILSVSLDLQCKPTQRMF
jgi:hypothetical protein